MDSTSLQTIEASEEDFNGGLVLKKNEGFQYLSNVEKAFLLCHLYQENDKVKAFALATGRMKEYEEKSNNLRITAHTYWKRIEKSMGGARNIILLMGVDIVYITNHAKRLIEAQKIVLDKNGVEHTMDDGATQIKALEFLSKLSGNYSEDIDSNNRASININFGSPPAGPVDIESDNMEVVSGSHKKIEND